MDSGNGICGFAINGHSTENENDEIGKLVCASVSSAAYMAANTITEIIGDNAEIFLNDAEMRLFVKEPSNATKTVLKGLKLHLTELSKEYGNNIRLYGGARYVKD